MRNTNTFMTNSAQRTGSGISGYIREESGLTVSYTEAESWFESVGALAANTERLEARIHRLNNLTNQSHLDGKES